MASVRGIAYRHHAFGKLRCLALFAVLGGAAAPTAYGAQVRSAAFVADGKTEWRSPERWPGSTDLTIKPLVGGEMMDYDRISSCAWYAYSRGVVLRLSVCGAPKRLVVKAASVKRRRVKIVYRW